MENRPTAPSKDEEIDPRFLLYTLRRRAREEEQALPQPDPASALTAALLSEVLAAAKNGIPLEEKPEATLNIQPGVTFIKPQRSNRKQRRARR